MTRTSEETVMANAAVASLMILTYDHDFKRTQPDDR